MRCATACSRSVCSPRLRCCRDLIGRMRGSFAWIEVNDLKRRLDGGEAVTVIDVRGPDEFTGPLGHIATARNIPVAELNADYPSLPGLNGSRSSSSAGPTSALRRLPERCVLPVLRRSVSCAVGWSNGTMPACPWKDRADRGSSIKDADHESSVHHQRSALWHRARLQRAEDSLTRC